MLAIGEVAARMGVAPSAIRYYESEGLIDPAVRVSGRRRYPESIFARLTIIRMAQEAGFSIVEIRRLVYGFAPEVAASERWHALAETKLHEIDARIARLERMRTVLHQSLACQCLTLDSCADICWT